VFALGTHISIITDAREILRFPSKIKTSIA